MQYAPVTPRMAARLAARARATGQQRTLLAAARRAHRAEAAARRALDQARRERAEAIAACLAFGISPTVVGRHIDPHHPLDRKTIRDLAAWSAERKPR